MMVTVASTQITQRYQVLNQLGAGGMGVVYRALDRLSGQVVALKQVTVDSSHLMFASRTDESQDSQAVRLALAHEFKTLASLRHPNIVSVIDYGFDTERQPFFTMSLLENAQTIVQAGHRQPGEAQYGLLIQLLQALLYLHRRGILHRDLKPSNVMVVHGQVKVLDFGLSVAHGEGGGASGTLAYIAPELLADGSASEASDLYAFGLMAYELLAGQHPFRVERMDWLVEDILKRTPDMGALRQPAGLTAVIERLLAKQPEERYSDTASALAAFSAATGQQFATETALTRESFLQAARFVGREAEMNQLSQALVETLNGRGGLWLIGGESGIGKSRLLDELRTLALVKGALALRGQAISEGGAPYLIWRDALRQLCLQTDLSELEKSVLKALVPDIGALLNCTVPDAPDLDSSATQERLISVMSDVFARQRQPTLAILEDMQWAGSESITVLQRIGRQADEQALMVIASYRSDERPDLPKALPDAQVFMLERLPQAQIADLSASILGEAIGSQRNLTDLLVRETEGNVFFVVEVLRALAEDAGQLDLIGTTALPASVFSGGMKTMVQRRLKRVTGWAHPLLQAAAVAGRQIDPVLLSAIEPSSPLDEWLSVCTEANVLQFQDNQWRFAHDKLREGTLDGLVGKQSVELHRRIALAVEYCYPDDPAQAAALANHWGAAGNESKEAYYAGLAGRQAFATGANAEAIRFLERADNLSKLTGTSLVHRAEFRALIGNSFQGLGDIRKAIDELDRALTLGGFPQPKGPAQTMLRILGSLAREIGHRFQFDVLKRPPRSGCQSEFFGVLSRASESMVPVMYVSNNKFALLYYSLLDLRLAELAGPSYRALQARAYANMILGMGFIPIHPIARYYQRLTQLAAQDASDPGTRTWTESSQGIYTVGLGKWSEADAHLTLGLEFAEQIGNTRRWSESQLFLAMSKMLQGFWGESKQRLDELYRRNLRSGDKQMQGVSRVLRAAMLLYEGEMDQVAAWLEQSYQLFTGVSDLSNVMNAIGILAQMCNRQGRLKMADEYLQQFLVMTSQDAPISLLLQPAYSGVLEVALTRYETGLLSEHRAVAVQALRAARSFGRVLDVGQPTVLLYSGWLAWLEGKPTRAAMLGEQAIRAAQRLDMPYTEGLARYHLGRHLPTGDGRRNEHLRHAEATFERFGATYDLERTRYALTKANGGLVAESR